MNKIAIVLLALLIAGVAVARDATQLSSDLPRSAAERYAGACLIGNSDIMGIQGYYGSWGYQNYAIPFNPMNEACVCGSGFSVKAVHMLLTTNGLFTSITVRAALLTAVDDGTGCLVPGAEIYASAPVTVTALPMPENDIEIPMDMPCITVGENYFMAFYIRDDNGGEASGVGLAIDSSPTPCYSYNDSGSGWVDLVMDSGIPGDNVMFADIDCCENPVANENSTWGEMKNQYR